MKRHSAEEIIPKLRQAEADLAQGLTIAQGCCGGKAGGSTVSGCTVCGDSKG